MAATTAKPSSVDPTRTDASYGLQFSDKVERREPDRRYYSFRYNFKPKRQADKTQRTLLDIPTASQSRAAPKLNISETSAFDDPKRKSQSKKQYNYDGSKLDSPEATVPFALVRNAAANEYTLHRLAGSYAFNLKDGAKHGDAINHGDTFENTATPNGGLLTNGTAHRPSGSSAATSPAHSINQEASGAESELDEVDTTNPFDWRNYIKEIPKSNEEKLKPNGSPALSATGTPLSRAASPLMQSRAASSRAAPTASPVPRSVPSASGTSKAPVKRREPTNPFHPANNKRARNTSSASQPQPLSRPITPAINVETPTPTTRSAPAFNKVNRPHSHSAPQRPQHDPNDLIIEGDEPAPPRRSHTEDTPAYMTPPGGRPMSLREAASRGASPLMPPRRGHGRTSSGNSGLGISGLGNGHSSAEVIDLGDGDGAEVESVSRRSNSDVGTDLELGSPAYVEKRGAPQVSSPAYEPQIAQLNKVGEQGDEQENDVEMEDAGRRESIDELENALQDALGGDVTGAAEDGNGEEGGDDDDQDIGDALAEALAAEGGEDEESEAE